MFVSKIADFHTAMNTADRLILYASIDDKKQLCAGSMASFGDGLSVELSIHHLFCVVVVWRTPILRGSRTKKGGHSQVSCSDLEVVILENWCRLMQNADQLSRGHWSLPYLYLA